MAKKLETIKLVASLEKSGRKTQKSLWFDLAERVDKPSRHNVVVNIEKLDKMAKKHKGKILLVPGKVLSAGELTEKATIVAVDASAGAMEKIKKKGEFIYLVDFAQKADSKNVVMVK